MRPSLTPSTELSYQKSDCVTFAAIHRAAVPRSAEADARVDTSEAINSTVGDWQQGRRARVIDHQCSGRDGMLPSLAPRDGRACVALR